MRKLENAMRNKAEKCLKFYETPEMLQLVTFYLGPDVERSSACAKPSLALHLQKREHFTVLRHGSNFNEWQEFGLRERREIT